MAQNHAPVKLDPRQVAEAQETWHSFMQATKYSIIGIAMLLIALALAFTDILINV